MAHNEVALRRSDVLWVSRNDDRAYKYVVLANGLRVVLMSDPTTDKAGAALSVSVGSFDDPEALPGLAHFLEHMLFLGNDRYPRENEYAEYLSDHGGYSNAYTAAEETNYHFVVAAGALEGALDRFARFFIAPLFTESATARELKAVDAEHAKNLQSDMWRVYQLDKSTSAAGHPYAKFGTGDSRTLRDLPAAAGVDVRAALLAFYAAHYSASRMTLAVVGTEPLPALEAWVAAKFGGVANNGTAPARVEGHPHAGRAGLTHYVVPVKDVRSLSLNWALPEQQSRYRTKSAHYLSHLVGHEGPGSLLEHLKALGWATELSAGPDTTSCFATFSVTVQLSAAGLAHVDDVVAAVYAYVGMLRAAGPRRWVFDETARQDAMAYRFVSKGQPYDLVVNTARDMARYPPEHVRCGGALVWDFDADEVRHLLTLLEPENSRVVLCAKAFAPRAHLTEPWYGTQYDEEPLPPAAVARCKAAAAAYGALTTARAAGTAADLPALVAAGVEGVHPPLAADAANAVAWAAALAPALLMPAPNEFIATDFELRNPAAAAVAAAAVATGATAAAATGATAAAAESGTAESGAPPAAGGAAASPLMAGIKPARTVTPVLIRDDAVAQVWWHGDDAFGVPKAYLQVELELPASYTSPRAFVLSDLLCRVLQQSLTEFAYAASLAELYYSLVPVVQGVQLRVGGFSDKLPLLAGRIAQRLAALDITATAFALQHDRLARRYASFDKEAPLQHALYGGSMATFAPKWHNDDKVAAVGSVTLAELRTWHATLLAAGYVTAVVVGNARRDDAAALADAVVAPLTARGMAPLTTSQHVYPRITALPAPVLLPRGGAPPLPVSFDWRYRQASRNADDPNAALAYTVQVGPTGVGAAVAASGFTSLVAHLLKEPFFDALRTKQALGYIVSAFRGSEGGTEGISFIVQSNKVDADELVARTDAFLVAFSDRLAAMSAAKFRRSVVSMLSQINESDKTLSEEADTLFGYVASGMYDFDRAAALTAFMCSVTQAQVVAWYRAHLLPGAPARRALLSLVTASPTAAAAAAKTSGGGGGGGGGDGGDDDEEEEEEAAGGKAADAGSGAEEDDGLPEPGVTDVPPAVAPDAVVTLPLTAAQAAAITHALTALTTSLGSVSATHAYDVFDRVGADLRGTLAAAPAAAAVRCIVEVCHYDDVRARLPTHPPPHATYFALARARAAAGSHH